MKRVGGSSCAAAHWCTSGGGAEGGGGEGGGGEGGGGEGGSEGGGGSPETVVASVKSTSHAIFAGAVPVALTRGRRLWRRTGVGTPIVRAPRTSMHNEFHPSLAFGWTMFSDMLVACSAAAFLAACFAAGVGPCTFFSRRVKATPSSTWSRARATL